MANIPSLKNWSDNEVVTAADLNSIGNTLRTYFNSYAVQNDKAGQTVSAAITFSALQTFGAGVTLSSGNLTFGAASAKVIPGATSLLFRDTGDANTNVSITDAGVVTVRAGLTVTAGGATITAGGLTVTAGNATITAGNVALTAGNLTFGAASAKIIPGATSLLFRNNADGATNLAITDAGAVTIRAGLTVTAGGITSTGVYQFGDLAATARILCNGTGISIQAAGGGFVTLGATGLATTATDQLPVMSTMAGAPSGSITTQGAFLFDRTNFKLYIHTGSAWKSVQLA